MGRTRRTRWIDAPPDAVFRAFTDPELLADWMEADGVVDLEGSLDRAESTYTLVIKGPWRFRVRVIESTAPHAYVYGGRGPLGTGFRISASLAESTPGTDLAVETEWSLPFGPLGRWLDRRWVEPGTQGEDDRELDRLVDIVTGHDDRSPRDVIRGGRRRREAAMAAGRVRGSRPPTEAGGLLVPGPHVDGPQAG
jgi:hypothetical protein